MESPKIAVVKRVWLIILALSAAWTTIVIAIGVVMISIHKSSMIALAREEAVASFEKDLVYRRWAAGHGGVYALVSDTTPPNPYLVDVPERDITTPSGRKLTLINPAYMTRQAHELGLEEYGLWGHITSINPINPDNVPDAWEKEALQQFEENPAPVSSVQEVDGQSYLRYMHPLAVDASCLKCHVSQGYQVGDIRGGISVSVSLSPYMANTRKESAELKMLLGGLWVLGLGGIGFAGRVISKSVSEQFKISQQYRSVVDNIGIGVAAIGQDMRILTLNRQMQQWFPDVNVSDQPICHRVFNNPPSEAPCSYCPTILTLQDGQVHESITETPAGDSIINFRIISSPIKNEQGEVVAAIEMVEDITEQKQIADVLKQSEETLRQILDSVSFGVIIVGRDKKVRAANKVAREMTGYGTDEEMQGVICHHHLCPAAVDQCPILDLHQTVDRSERRLLTNTGKSIPILKSVVPIVLNGEEVLLESFMDITTLKETENQLRAATKQAQAANQSKSEFLANMSHELRTPMNSILGFSDLLTDDSLTEEQRDYLETIQDNGNHLLELLGDILDFSKMEAGKLDIESVACSLRAILAKVYSMTVCRAETKGLDFQINFCRDLADSIVTDSTRLTQSLVNLAGNAVKFTETGHVYINVSSEDKDGRPYVRFDVEDTGIGIPEDKQEMIFDSFTQADGSTTRKYGGTGLGLAITRKLVALLGGHLTVHSEVGKGSVFSFSLPKQPVQPSFPEQEAAGV